MKKFILHCLSFILILVILFHIEPLYLIYADKYKYTVAGSEIYYSIDKSKQKRKVKKLLLGDSIGYQLFSNKTNNDPINSLACNQAIGLVGHFILLNNYLLAGNQLDTVFLLFSPFSFANNLDQVYTYHYFLKPFYKDEYLPLFTERVNQQIRKIPYYSFCRYPYILTSNWAPDFVSKDEVNYSFLSPISVEYLIKMKELSVKYKFNLIIIATPTRLSHKWSFENMNKDEIVKNNLSKEFENYFKNIIYLDDDNFIDQVHLRDPEQYTEYYQKNIIK
jgi:hypothetical protein